MSLPLPPSSHQGPFVVTAVVTAKDGKAEEVRKHLSKVRASAESDKEPDCLSYRPTRDLHDSNVFRIFEKYTTVDALKHHFSQPAFQDFVNAGLADVELKFTEEIGVE